MKKAFIPMILIVIFGVVGGLTFAWYLSLQAGKFGNLTMIGKDQLALIDVATAAESVLFGVDLIAQLTADSATHDAFSTGIPSACGTFGGMPLYSTAQGLCLPQQNEIEHDLSIFFHERYEIEVLRYATVFSLNLSNASSHASLSQDMVSFTNVPQEPLIYTITLGAGAR